jgi:hypothetical protein
MQQIKQLKYNRLDNHYGSVVFEQSDVKIKFQDAKGLMKFINSGDEIFKCGTELFKIVKIIKLKHSSFIAKIEKITLREYNLEKLLV